MTKKETELFEGLVTLVAASMEVQKETLTVLKRLMLPPGTAVTRVPHPSTEAELDEQVAPTLASTPEPEPTAPPVVEKPREYTIEDCRQALGAMVEKLGEERAWAYLKTFKVDMLPDLDPSQYAVLVQGAEAELSVSGHGPA